MASLLDFIIQSRMPQGGLLGQGGTPPEANPLAALSAASPSPSAPPSGGGGGDVLSRLFAGGVDPSLSQGENESIRQQAMLTAGLGTLASDPSRGTLGRLAEGIMTGHVVSGQIREKLKADKAEQARALEMMDVFGEGPLSRDQVTQGIRLALVRNDPDTADSLRQLLDHLPEEGEASEMEFVNLQGVGTYLTDGEGNLFDPFTREPVNVPPEPEEDDPMDGAFTDTVFGDRVTPEIARLAIEQGLDPQMLEQAAQQGFRVRFRKDGTPMRILGAASAPEPEEAGGGGQAATLRRNLDTLDTIIEENGIPNRVQRHLPNEMAPEWVQRYYAAAGNIEINAARAMFGARVSDSEREALSEVLTPRPGDDTETIRQKMENLQRLVEDFERQEGVFDPNRQPGSGGLGRYGASEEDVRLDSMLFGGGQ